MAAPRIWTIHASPREAKCNGWEFMGRSYEQRPIHMEGDQAAMIERSLSILERFTGTPPVGWLGPGLGQRAIDQFDRLYQEGKERAKIMALAVHPYISGQPHRIKSRSDLRLRGAV
jgi:hypothetical protein